MKENNSFSIKKILKKFGPLLALIILSIILYVITDGLFLHPRNVMNVFRQIPIIAFTAIGMLSVIIIAGIDLSVGSILAMSIVTAGVAMNNFGVTNPILIISIIILTGTFSGIINGLLLVKLELPHPFISTLGTMNIYRGIALLISGAAAISGFPRATLTLGTMNVFNVPLSFILVLIVYGIMHFFLTRTPLGRKIYVFGGNKDAAKLSGIDTDKLQIIVYGMSGFFASIAGLVYLGRMNSAVPLAGMMGELDAIAAVIIGGASFMGGKGTVWGTLIGATMIAVIRNGANLLGLSSDLQLIIIGTVIIIAVFVDVLRVKMEEKAKLQAAAEGK